jgi:hypothetical protein
LVEGRNLWKRTEALEEELTRTCICLSGLITTILGLILLFIVPEDPSKSRMLNVAERKLALDRIDADQVVKSQGKKEKTTLPLVLRSFNTIVSSASISLLRR